MLAQPLIRTWDFNIEQYRQDYNDMRSLAELWRQVAILSLQYAAACRERDADYHKLLADSNEWMHVAQQALAWRDENNHLWGVIEELDKQLREVESGQ